MLFVVLACTAEEAFEPSAYDPSEFLPDEAAPVLEPVQVEAAEGHLSRVQPAQCPAPRPVVSSQDGADHCRPGRLRASPSS